MRRGKTIPVFGVFCILVSGCLNGGSLPTVPGDDVLIIDPNAGPALFLDPLWVENAWIEGDDLKLQVSYSGGCETHSIRAYAANSFTASAPRELPVFLRHDSNGDGCRSIVRETLSFDISPARDLHRSIFGTDGLFYFQINTLSAPENQPVARVLYHSGIWDSPRPDQEAEHMALLMNRELVAPQEIYDQVRTDLQAIRENYGDARTIADRPLREVTFWAPWVPGELLLQLDPESLELARHGLYTGWNDLNTALRIMDIEVSPVTNSVRLVFSVQLHPCVAANWYLSLPGVVYAGSNHRDGDAPNIFPGFMETGISYVFREAWGDCPAGCIDSEYWYFQKLNGEHVLLGRFNPRLDDPPPSWWETADQNLWFYNNQGLCWIR